jgi:iron-sulfur cluster repair protein YtfE (RIC family)
VAAVQAEHQVVRQQLQEIQRVAATLTSPNGSVTERQAQFTRLQEEFALTFRTLLASTTLIF